MRIVSLNIRPARLRSVRPTRGFAETNNFLICHIADAITVVFAFGTAAFSVVYYVLLETKEYGKLRTAFDTRPWRNRENVYLTQSFPTEDVKLNGSCPFSKKIAKGTCPICSTCTSRDGYHHGDPQRLHNTVGVSMIEYDMARKATEREDNLVMGRIQLDTLLNYRGNYLFGTISPSCKGCYLKTWCWNVAYRMTWQSAIIGFNSLLCTFIFSSDITIVYADLKNTLLCVSAFFSASTLVMQLAILASSIVFNIEHPFMDKACIPRWVDINNKLMMTVLYYLADPVAKFGVPPTKEYWQWLTETPPRRRVTRRNKPIAYKGHR